MPPRKIVPRDQALRIIDAVEALAAAKVERDAAIVAALKGGASVREVAAVANMSVRQTQTIGHAGGWPTAAQKAQWEKEKAERYEWAEIVKAYREGKTPPRARGLELQ